MERERQAKIKKNGQLAYALDKLPELQAQYREICVLTRMLNALPNEQGRRFYAYFVSRCKRYKNNFRLLFSLYVINQELSCFLLRSINDLPPVYEKAVSYLADAERAKTRNAAVKSSKAVQVITPKTTDEPEYMMIGHMKVRIGG